MRQRDIDRKNKKRKQTKTRKKKLCNSLAFKLFEHLIELHIKYWMVTPCIKHFVFTIVDF